MQLTVTQSRAEQGRADRELESKGEYSRVVCGGIDGSSGHPVARGWHRQGMGVARGRTQACIFLKQFLRAPTTSEDLCGSLNNSHKQTQQPHTLTHTHSHTANNERN